MHAKILAVLSALLVAGCVSAGPDAAQYGHSGSCSAHHKAPAVEAASPDDDGDEAYDPKLFAARSGGTSNILLTVDGKYITGPNVSLGRYSERAGRALRGVAYGSIVDLRVHDHSVKGAIDNDAVNLDVRRRGTALDVAGFIPGRVSRFRIDAEHMRGIIGRCAYDLVRSGTGFTGRRSCGSSVGSFTLDLPETMASWADADIAAVFAVLLRGI